MRANASRRPLDSALHDFPGRHRINASIIRDTITGLAAIAIAAAALVAGCGGQASVPLPAHSTSVHAPTASPSPADTGSATAQVIAAYTAYFPASKAAEAAAPSRAQAILAPYAAQPYLRNVLAQMAGYRARGETAWGYVVAPHHQRHGRRQHRRGARLPGRQPRRPGQHQHREGDPGHSRESRHLPDRQPRPRLATAGGGSPPSPTWPCHARPRPRPHRDRGRDHRRGPGRHGAGGPRRARRRELRRQRLPVGLRHLLPDRDRRPGSARPAPARPPPGPSARRARCTRSRETRTICCRSARTG